MKPLFVRKKVVPYQSLIDLLEDSKDKPFEYASLYSEKGGTRVDPNIRSTSRKNPSAYEWIDINNSLLKMLPSFGEDPNEYEVREYNILEYQTGDKFSEHIDRITRGEPRQYSTSTIIQASDDLEGGELVIKSSDGFVTDLNLEIGETVMFSSSTKHEVLEVTKGVRLVLVAWIYKKKS